MLAAIMLNAKSCKLGVGFFFSLLYLYCAGFQNVQAGDQNPTEIPTRYAMAVSLGNTVDPVTDITFFQLSGFVMWDYDRIWRHWAPDALRFKVEASAGMTLAPRQRLMAAAGMSALYYIEPLSNGHLRPYLEGGIGGIYTDFRVEGQGARLNFNPQIGIGTEFGPDRLHPFFGTLRFSHISNAGLLKENRGVNSVVLMVGRFF